MWKRLIPVPAAAALLLLLLLTSVGSASVEPGDKAVLPEATTNSWQQVFPETTPSGIGWPAMAFDAARGVTVLFGGGTEHAFGGTILGETWLFDGNTWTQAAVETGPSARWTAGMVFDEARQMLVLFGGLDPDGTPLNDTWEWDGENWSQIDTPESPPPRGVHGQIAYDPERQQVILFGGGTVPEQPVFNDTWAYDGATWTQLADDGPSARVAGAMAFDPILGGILLFGGGLWDPVFNDTWLWNGDAWQQLDPATSPQARQSAQMVYDPLRNRALLFGGDDMANLRTLRDDIWEWDGNNWTPLEASGPSRRCCFGFAFDGQRRATLLFGGTNSETWYYPAPETGNETGDLHIEGVSVDPQPASAYEVFDITARIGNSSTQNYQDVGVHFRADGTDLIAEGRFDAPAGQVTEIGAQWFFEEVGVHQVQVSVNPDQALPETTFSNNDAEVPAEVVWEKNPRWLLPDLVLANVTWTPHRPEDGQTVVFTGEVLNPTRNEAGASRVTVRIDDRVVDEQNIPPLLGEGGQAITLTWTDPAPGRYPLQIMVDPDGIVAEKQEANNLFDDWIRVAGGPNPLPDIEVEGFVLEPQTPLVDEKAAIQVMLRNEGHAPASNLPVQLRLDGNPIGSQIIPQLDPEQSTTLQFLWQNVGEGPHTLDLLVDPEVTLDLDNLASAWSYAAIVPGYQVQLIPPTRFTGQWTFVGPRPITESTRIHSGRVDHIAISQQDSSVLAVGSLGGGIWSSRDGGSTWSPQGDLLPSPQFPAVAMDPKNHNILYAASADLGLYKTLDGGARWFAFTPKGWLEDTAPPRQPTRKSAPGSYTDLVVRYEGRNSQVTLYAATNRGLWIWQGDALATRAQQNEWTQVWSHDDNGRAGAPSCASNNVTDLLITAGSSPDVFVGVYDDGVYRIPLSNLLTSLESRAAPVWTPLVNGLQPVEAAFQLGSSAARPKTVMLSTMQRVSVCGSGNGVLALYRTDLNATPLAWTRVSTPTETMGTIRYNAFLALHPTKPDTLFVTGVPGWRSMDGGKTFTTISSTVHVDYKDYAFDPKDPSVVYFSSDGGIYRCANDGVDCVSLNADLETVMFYDIAVANTANLLIIGGTQDNGTLRFDSPAVGWNHIRNGDGYYTAIDPNNAKVMYSQEQYAPSTRRSEDGGKSWSASKIKVCQKPGDVDCLPSNNDSDPYLLMDPRDNKTVVVATRSQLYRSTNGGQTWSPFGPTNGQTGSRVRTAALDTANNRYYAGTDNGQIWARDLSLPNSATDWQRIFTHTARSRVREILIDPRDSNTLYSTHGGGGTGRVMRLRLGSGGNWRNPADWQTLALAGRMGQRGSLPGNLGLTGGPNSAVRGLIKDPVPGEDILYVGTTRGVYRGRPAGTVSAVEQWDWSPDSCGLPLTYISDLALHPSNTMIVAATYGRGVYTRTVAQSFPGPDRFDTPTRNDTWATRKAVSGTVSQNMLMPGLVVSDLNLDRPNDTDYFTVTLDTSSSLACLKADDVKLQDPRTRQCAFGVTVHAPDSPDPFELRLYQPGSNNLHREFTTISPLTYEITRPLDSFPTGEIVLSVRQPSGCRSGYNLHFWLRPWHAELDAPKLLTDPPLFNWVLPELGQLRWLFPGDPALIQQAFVGKAPDPLPAQRAVFRWDRAGDFGLNLAVEGRSGLDVSLIDAAGQTVVGPVAVAAASSGQRLEQAPALQVPDLPVGWYALEFRGGGFPTYFQAEIVQSSSELHLPLLQR